MIEVLAQRISKQTSAGSVGDKIPVRGNHPNIHKRASLSVLHLLGLILIVFAVERFSTIPIVLLHDTHEDDEKAVLPALVHPQESYRCNARLMMSRQRLANLRGPEGPKYTVLVTGAAGFVGMHTAIELKRLGMAPIGYDNMNAYYSTDLKESRVAELGRKDITFVRGDVCDYDLLTETIRKHNVTRFIHLAAQAGVRYSLDHPLEYTRNNVDCTVRLLEVMVELGLTNSGSVVYASSSSVYGNNVKVPFHETDQVDDPASLYAATKRSDELIARTYYNLYNITSIGLRFFTVYGPYGRPDMAPWMFTDKISNNETIQVFNHGKSHRDFTYIDDIVQGVVNSLFVETGQPELINLGNGRPVLLADFVRIVEDNVGWDARIESLGMQKGDVPKTYADISKAKYLLGYNPSTPIETGITNFVAWFKEHQASRYRMGNAAETTSRATPSTM
jgi:UDP-glucuronate 4-epimerase